MNRNRFILALLGAFGVARAQKNASTNQLDVVLGKKLQMGWQLGKAVNGQCPACGEMAAPFVRPTTEIGNKLVPCDPPAPKDSNIACMERHVEPYGPTEQITRCRTCNAAFWQDAE